MKKVKNKRKKAGLGLVIFVGALLYFSWLIISQQNMLDEKIKEMQDIRTKIEAEKKLNKELKEEKEILKSDEFVEKVAREKLGMVKSGEKVFVDVNK